MAVARTSDPVADLRRRSAAAAGELRGRRPGAAAGARAPAASPTSATTRPTPRCCSRRRWASRRARWPSGSARCWASGSATRSRRSRSPGPGFLNLFMTDGWYPGALAGLLAAGDGFGEGRPAEPERVHVEFVSANPTGPAARRHRPPRRVRRLARRILELAGHEVEREYYVNDYGTQVTRFGESIRARARGEEPPEDGYQGEYVAELAAQIDGAAEADPDELARRGVELMLERVNGDARALPRALRPLLLRARAARGRRVIAIERSRSAGTSTSARARPGCAPSAFGDDKDRVLQRSDGRDHLLRRRHRLPRRTSASAATTA